MPQLNPDSQRRFALDVVRKLRRAGFAAYWAGGCVRDQLLGRTPKDYDVVTDATPDAIRQLFGPRRSLAIGAAFGVITVIGPEGAGQIEVATFRCDADYSDGRHPDSVRFSTARDDASRRDFTINGIFYDPIGRRVIDFVEGRKDLARRVIRAIGDPRQRIGEDKLRMLRAVRFAATFGFALDPATFEAVRAMAPQITVVSPERIAAEIERMLIDSNRAAAVRLLVATGLGAAVLPEVLSEDDDRLEPTLAILGQLDRPGFALALAGLLHRHVDAAQARRVCKRWRLSNHDTSRVAWLVEHQSSLRGAPAAPWSRVQPILIAPGADDLLALNEAAARAGCAEMHAGEIAWCRAKRSLPRDQLDPPPLLTGDDLIRHGVPQGPAYRALLEKIRRAQLDSQIHAKTEALDLVDQWLEAGEA